MKRNINFRINHVFNQMCLSRASQDKDNCNTVVAISDLFLTLAHFVVPHHNILIDYRKITQPLRNTACYLIPIILIIETILKGLLSQPGHVAKFWTTLISMAKSSSLLDDI